MSDNLTALITRAQAQLLDDGTLFSIATLTSAFRQALRYFNQVAPINAAELVAVVASQKTYELTGGDFPALILDILDVLLNDENGDDDRPLLFDRIFEDNRVWIRLRTAEQSGHLLVRYTTGHTVNGLDSEVESTFNADQDQILVDGACGFACYSRSLSRVEALNLFTKTATPDYAKAARLYMRVFAYGVSRYAGRPMPVSEPSTLTWLNDELGLSSSSQAGVLTDL